MLSIEQIRALNLQPGSGGSFTFRPGGFGDMPVLAPYQYPMASMAIPGAPDANGCAYCCHGCPPGAAREDQSVLFEDTPLLEGLAELGRGFAGLMGMGDLGGCSCHGGRGMGDWLNLSGLRGDDEGEIVAAYEEEIPQDEAQAALAPAPPPPRFVNVSAQALKSDQPSKGTKTFSDVFSVFDPVGGIARSIFGSRQRRKDQKRANQQAIFERQQLEREAREDHARQVQEARDLAVQRAKISTNVSNGLRRLVLVSRRIPGGSDDERIVTLATQLSQARQDAYGTTDVYELRSLLSLTEDYLRDIETVALESDPIASAGTVGLQRYDSVTRRPGPMASSTAAGTTTLSGLRGLSGLSETTEWVKAKRAQNRQALGLPPLSEPSLPLGKIAAAAALTVGVAFGAKKLGWI